MEKTQIWLRFEQLAMVHYYRLVHKSEVPLRKQELMAEGYMAQHPMVVKRRGVPAEDPENKKLFDVVDGMHRMTALCQLYIEHGMQIIYRICGPDGTIPCHVLFHDTPEYLLAAFASDANISNKHFAEMTWMDAVFNMAKFAIFWTKEQISKEASQATKPTVSSWVARSNKDLYQATPSSTNWSDFQKKMGFAKWCMMKPDVDAIEVDSLAYRDGRSARSMFFVALLFDEMDYEDTCKFRRTFKIQLGPEYTGKLGDFTEQIFNKHQLVQELAVYPGLFTSGKASSKKEMEAEYLNPSPTHQHNLLMKFYMLVGRWMINPKPTTAELNYERRTELVCQLLS